MTQTQNRILDELGRLFTNAAGAAQGVRTEAATGSAARPSGWSPISIWSAVRSSRPCVPWLSSRARRTRR